MNTPFKLIFVTTLLLCVATAETKLGKELTLRESVSIASLLAKPDQHIDKTVQVKGRVTEVCQSMGCWMALADADGRVLRIKVKDGEIVFPKHAVEKTAVAEGKLIKIELTREQAVARARHEAEEQGRKFDPESVKVPATIYQISGTGAVILD